MKLRPTPPEIAMARIALTPLLGTRSGAAGFYEKVQNGGALIVEFQSRGGPGCKFRALAA